MSEGSVRVSVGKGGNDEIRSVVNIFLTVASLLSSCRRSRVNACKRLFRDRRGKILEPASASAPLRVAVRATGSGT